MNNISRRFKQLINRLKKTKPKKLDDQFHHYHDEVFANTNCLECANCCKTTSPIFLSADISRISKHLDVKPSEFHEKYLMTDEEGDYILKKTPCSFLSSENKCEVYDFRPRACREYPHTNRKRMSQVLDLTLTNASICPAVEQILEKLSKYYE